MKILHVQNDFCRGVINCFHFLHLIVSSNNYWPYSDNNSRKSRFSRVDLSVTSFRNQRLFNHPLYAADDVDGKEVFKYHGRPDINVITSARHCVSIRVLIVDLLQLSRSLEDKIEEKVD